MFCQGQTAVLTAPSGYEAYTWQDGSHNQSYTAFLPGIYWLTVFNGCEFSSDTVMVIETQLNINLNHNGQDTICKIGLPFQLNAPSGYSSYLWSNGATTPSINVAAIGTYSLSVTEAGGCSGRDTLWVIDCLSLDDLEKSGTYAVYPNPADQYFQLIAMGKENLFVRLFTVSGQLLMEKEIASESQLLVSTADYAAGLHFLEISAGGRKWHEKLVITH